MQKEPSARQFQDDLDQYSMPDAVKQSKQETINVGYEASTGNQTSPDHNISKKGKMK